MSKGKYIDISYGFLLLHTFVHCENLLVLCSFKHKVVLLLHWLYELNFIGVFFNHTIPSSSCEVNFPDKIFLCFIYRVAIWNRNITSFVHLQSTKKNYTYQCLILAETVFCGDNHPKNLKWRLGKSSSVKIITSSLKSPLSTQPIQCLFEVAKWMSNWHIDRRYCYSEVFF